MRTKGAKGKVDLNDLQLANDIRLFIKQNDLNLNLLRHKLKMRNSSIYYFMSGKTNLISWLPIIKDVLQL